MEGCGMREDARRYAPDTNVNVCAHAGLPPKPAAAWTKAKPRV